jgi:hypothetical protein
MGYVQQEVNMTLLVVACDALFARIACELACLLSLACLLLVAIACLLKTKICFNKNGKERRRAVTERTSKEKSKKDDTKATRCLLARLSRSNPSSIISGSVHQKEFQHSLLII